MKLKINERDHNYDGLMFFTSSHGESQGVILDSICEEYGLQYIFSKFYGKIKTVYIY